MSVVANRYARALADVVFQRKLDPRQTEQELNALATLVESAPELRTVWENPSVEAEQKHHVLDAIVARVGASRIVRNFVALLIDHRRIAALPEIARQVELEVNQRFGLVDAEVTTARPLDDSAKRALEARVAVVIGKKVRARYAQNLTLLGGAVVKVGSTVYDGSIRGQLQRLKTELSQA
jgi:F-type H+-transporting ATPase subunit delta